jgi:hypothetical protein
MEQLKKYAAENCNFPLGHLFNEKEFLGYYNSGADIEEAILQHENEFGV